MRRKVTLNLDESFVAMLDAARGHVPRSRYIEQLALAEGESATSQANYARAMLAVSQGADPESGPLIIKSPAKDERSPEPQAGSEASQESPKSFWPPSEITAADVEAAEAERRARVKPPLPRPIIQKRGT